MRDFDSEFRDMMVPQAATDPELVDLYSSRMFLDEVEEPGTEEFVRGLIKWQYDLDQPRYRKAAARCVARLAGVRVGVERTDV